MYIHELANLSGVSTRTLRYYDEIGLLVPEKNEETAYRIYKQQDIDRLQQILFYRELGMPLGQIKDVLNEEGFEQLKSLREHQEALFKKGQYINGLLKTVTMTIQSIEEGLTMTNEQKFKVFKKHLIDHNEEHYGKEIRERHGEESVLATYGMVRNMTEEKYKAAQQLENMLLQRIREGMEDGSTTSELATEVGELHKRWLSFYWPKYTKEAHVGLAQLYMADQRFIDYYDSRVAPDATKFLTDCIAYYTGIK